MSPQQTKPSGKDTALGCGCILAVVIGAEVAVDTFSGSGKQFASDHTTATPATLAGPLPEALKLISGGVTVPLPG